jgi:hypothetical protein
MVQNQRISRLFRRAGRVCRGCGWMFVAASILALAAQGQAIASVNDGAASPQDVVTALHQMSDKAGVIFVGKVSEVRRGVSGNVAAGVVEIRFEVEQAVRGCSAGGYVLREWAGLWEGDNQRYRAGQRLLMLLHAPNAAGLSSPVDGMDGAIPIVRGGSAPLTANSAARQARPAVDLRWVGTKVQRPVSYARGTARGDHSESLPAHADAQGPTGPVTGLSASDGQGAASVAARQVSVDDVVSMLMSWQKARDEVR